MLIQAMGMTPYSNSCWISAVNVRCFQSIGAKLFTQISEQHDYQNKVQKQ